MLSVEFEDALDHVLPPDLPHREQVVRIAAQHLRMIAEANNYMNLTRITTPLEAATKHVFDSVAPWRLFAGVDRVMDAGTGAGFPGIPLSAVLPETRWTLVESTGKKARFVDETVDALELPNVSVLPKRAEQVALTQKPPVIITARAMAPLARLVDLFRQPLRNGARLLLYKGPDVDTEIASLKSSGFCIQVIERYQLPQDAGSRTVVEVKK